MTKAITGRQRETPVDEFRTELVFVLDASGSMFELTSDTIGGFNSMIEKNREEPGEVKVSTVVFNDSSKIVHDRVDISDVSRLTSKEYRCSGCTALLDAIGTAIERQDIVQSALPEELQAGKVLVAITTDGLENASRRFTYRQIKQMIESRRSRGWEFLFIGANMDAVEEASKLGVNPEMAANYVADEAGTDAVYAAMAEATTSFRCCGSIGSSWSAKLEEDFKKRG